MHFAGPQCVYKIKILKPELESSKKSIKKCLTTNNNGTF